MHRVVVGSEAAVGNSLKSLFTRTLASENEVGRNKKADGNNIR